MRKNRTVKLAVILLILTVLITAPAQSEEKAPPISNTRAVDYIVRVTVQSEIISTEDDIRSLVFTSGVAQKAAHKVFNHPLGDVIERITAKTKKQSHGLFHIYFHARLKSSAEIKPAAAEFADAVIINLESALNDAHRTYEAQLRNQLEEAEKELKEAQQELSMVSETPADIAVNKQLEQIADLSKLAPDMPFNEAIEVIKNSVDPPLKLNIRWRDLEDNAHIERNTSIEMDGIFGIPLRKGLKELLISVSGEPAKLAYEIEDGLITIATAESLPNRKENFLQEPLLDLTTAKELRQKLLTQIQAPEMLIARMDARNRAIQKQISTINNKVETQYANDDTIQELREIRKIYHARKGQAKDESERLLATEALVKARLALSERRDQISKTVGGDQLPKLNSELTELTIDLAGTKAELEVLNKQLKQAQKSLAIAAVQDRQASKVRDVAKALKISRERVKELKIQIASLKRPTITVLGGN